LEGFEKDPEDQGDEFVSPEIPCRGEGACERFAGDGQSFSSSRPRELAVALLALVDREVVVRSRLGVRENLVPAEARASEKVSQRQ